MLTAPGASVDPAPAVACEHLTVRFGDVVALRDVCAAFESGRIHAVVGQNGAGKTTFARVCAGLVQPTTGQLTIAGRPVPTGSVSAVRARGVELVHQSFALPPSFTVAEAMEFGSLRRGAPVFSRAGLERRWRAHLAALDVGVHPGDRIRDLPVELQQGVEIARALVCDARVLILDEPTAVLAPPAIERLFGRIRRLRETGVTVLVILHKIHEVLGIAETISVLRGGSLVAQRLPAAGMSARDLAHAMIGAAANDARAESNASAAAAQLAASTDAARTGGGRPAVRGTFTVSRDAAQPPARARPAPRDIAAGTTAASTAGRRATPLNSPPTARAERVSASTDARDAPISVVRGDVRDARDHSPALQLVGMSTRAGRQGPALCDVNLDVCRAEIVGIAGVEGNGQRTLVSAIAGAQALTAGRLLFGRRDLTTASLLERRAHGLRLIPFERNVEGLSLSSPLWQNWSARTLVTGGMLRLIDPAALRAASRAALARWSVRFASVDDNAGALSGGNAQKTIFARELDDDAALIIAAQPTRGLDIEAMAFVWEALRTARDRGCGVLVISSDLDELFDISDRIIVLLGGRVAAEFSPPYDLGAIGAAMTGAPS